MTKPGKGRAKTPGAVASPLGSIFARFKCDI